MVMNKVSANLGRRIARTTVYADVAALKVASQGDEKSQLINEVQFLLRLQHEGIVRACGIYQVKVEGRKQCWYQLLFIASSISPKFQLQRECLQLYQNEM